MSADLKDSLSNFKVIGGTIKLNQRQPYNNLEKENYFRVYSRPSSALPRLCSEENLQDRSVVSIDNPRPFSADFALPKNFLRRSKESLSNVPAENLCDQQRLPSSHLFEELLEEDMEKLRLTEQSHLQDANYSHTIRSQRGTTDTLAEIYQSTVCHEQRKIRKIPDNISIKSKEDFHDDENEEGVKNKFLGEPKINVEDSFTESITETNQNTLNEMCILAPGLTSKPPLPRKNALLQLEPDKQFENGNYCKEAFSNDIDICGFDKHNSPKVREEINNPEIIYASEEFRTPNLESRRQSSTLKMEVKREPPYLQTGLLTDKPEPNGSNEPSFGSIEWVLPTNLKQKPQRKEEYIHNELQLSARSNEGFPLLSEIDIDDLFNFDSKEKSTNPHQNEAEIQSELSSSTTSSIVNTLEYVLKEPPSQDNAKKKFTSSKHSVNENVCVLNTQNDNTITTRKSGNISLNQIDASKQCEMRAEEDIDNRTRPMNKFDNAESFNFIARNMENDVWPEKETNINKFAITLVSSLEQDVKNNEIQAQHLNIPDNYKYSDENAATLDGNKIVADMWISQDLIETAPNQDMFLSGNQSEKSDFSSKSINYKQLVSYLDKEDEKCSKTFENAKDLIQNRSNAISLSSNSFETIPKVEDLVSYSSEELASYVISLTLRVKDKSSCIRLLQNELSQLREKILEQSKETELVLHQKLMNQKEEAERITKRHQKFIDRLMEEKKSLARRCEELVQETTTMETRFLSNIKAVEHRHQVEMQKLKDMHTTTEKLKRERWLEDKTQKIKEMALKSMGPELERMEKRYQEDISNLRMVHKREIEALELRAARKEQEHLENLREQLIQDREKALAHERDVMRLRYEKLVESEEKNYQDQRRRLLSEHANRMAECEERETQTTSDKERIIKQMHEEYEEKLQAAARRQANEIKLVKETAIIEIENWKNSFRKQQTSILTEKETLIRKECQKERDREIEAVIERLEKEANKARSQIEQTAKNRISRIKEKYETEIRDMEILEKDAQTKYCEIRSKLLEYEGVIMSLRNSVKQLETQLAEENLKRSQLELGQEEVRQAIGKEYQVKMQSLELEVKRLTTLTDRQIEELYSRVRVSLARKDELLEELTGEHKALKEKCAYLESMIEQQRKEYVLHTSGKH